MYAEIYVILKTMLITVALNIYYFYTWGCQEKPSMLAKVIIHIKKESLMAPVIKMSSN